MPNQEQRTGRKEEEVSVTVIEVSNYAMKVKLEDGSDLRVVFYNSPTSSNWILGDTKVLVRQGDGWPYSYNTFLTAAEGRGVNAQRLV